MSDTTDKNHGRKRRKNKRPSKHVRDKRKIAAAELEAHPPAVGAEAEADDWRPHKGSKVFLEPTSTAGIDAHKRQDFINPSLQMATVEQLEEALIAKVPALKKQRDVTQSDVLIYGLIKGRHKDLLDWAAQVGQMTPYEAVRIYMTRNLVEAKKHQAHAEGRTGGTTLELNN